MNGLTSFQAKILANFCSNISQGALLVGVGFSVGGSVPLQFKAFYSMSAILFAFIFLSASLEIAKQVKEND